MPIGTIIGWLIGQFIIGVMAVYNNQPSRKQMTEASTLGRQFMHCIGLILSFTAFFAFIGTMIELIVR